MSIPWKWAAKTVTQKAISLSPAPTSVNHKIQDWLHRSAPSTADVRNRVDLCRHHLEAFEQVGLGSVEDGIANDVSVLEVGTGWSPIVPMLLWLCGADEVIGVDHLDHLSDDLFDQTAHLICDLIESNELEELLPGISHTRAGELVSFVSSGGSPHDLEALMHFRRVIEDVSALEIEKPVDALVSNLVLEHIHAEDISTLLHSSFELVRAGGVMSHVIDLCDHGHYVDSAGVTAFNYLRFGSHSWKLIGNDIQYENRLRMSQYRSLFEAADVPIDQCCTRLGDWDQLASVPIAEEFRNLDPEDLMVIFAHTTSIVPAVSA